MANAEMPGKRTMHNTPEKQYVGEDAMTESWQKKCEGLMDQWNGKYEYYRKVILPELEDKVDGIVKEQELKVYSL